MTVPLISSSRDFTSNVLDSREPVVVTFRASYCLPSQQLSPVMDAIAENYDGRCRVMAVDLDNDSDGLRERFKVDRLPVTMLFEDGIIKDFIGGQTSAKTISEMIDRRLQPVLELSELTFDREVMNSRVPVLVHFGALWCEASLSLVPQVEEIARSFRGKARVTYVEFGPPTERLCARFDVLRVPTIALFVGGQVVDQIFGAMVGGTKVGNIRSSCVGLTTTENIAQLIDRFV
jgi:thioredoxin 1